MRQPRFRRFDLLKCRECSYAFVNTVSLSDVSCSRCGSSRLARAVDVGRREQEEAV